LRALVIADAVPAANDGDSQTVLAKMRALHRSGHAISFATAVAPLVAHAATAALSQQGASYCGPPVYTSVEAVLRRQAGCFDVIYLHGLANAARYQALARQYCPRARILCGAAGGPESGVRQAASG
jgi:hypothetical protein